MDVVRVVNSLVDHLTAFFQVVGEFGLFCFRAIADSFRRPFEIEQIITQLFEIGWRSTALIAVAGFAIGVALAMQNQDV
jgi:ABC-type transporter Mla maintaining outer membrane lipid asymmetry permease subunit MlaE